MPDALAGAGIEADDAVAEQVVPGPIAAVEIIARCAEGQINVPEIVIGADHGPDVGPTELPPRSRFPGIGTELALSRNRVEGPQQFPRVHIVTAHIPWRSFVGQLVVLHPPVNDGRTHDDDVSTDHRRRRVGIGPALYRPAQSQSQVKVSAVTECRVGQTRNCVQGVHVTGKCAEDDPLLFTVTPVGNAAVK